jgi:hypothetical protein
MYRVTMHNFLPLLSDMENLLADEGIKRRAGREGSLIVMDSSPMVVIGDIHGDLRALEAILRETEIEDKIQEGWKLVCLGDYADRGPDPLEVYVQLFGLKRDYPGSVHLLKGNHEAPDLKPFQPHDLPWHIQSSFPERWREVYADMVRVQQLLPVAAIADSWLLLLHGGLSPGINRDSLIKPTKEDLEHILWNDPSEQGMRVAPSPRGAGLRFNSEVTREVLGRLGVRHLIRSHQVTPEGYRFNHQGMVLTIMSAKNVFDLDRGAYLVLKPFEPLESCIRMF